MTPKPISNGILRALAITVGVVITCYFLYAIRSVLLYIAIAAVVALVGRPLVYFFRKRLKVPNQAAVILALLFIFTIILGILALFIPIISQQTENFHKINFEELQTNLSTLNIEVRNYLGLEQANIIQSLHLKDYISSFNFKSIPLFMSSIFGKMGAIFFGGFSVIFIAFFFLKDSNLLLNSFLAFAKKGNEQRFERIFNKIKNLLSRYFVGIALQIFVLFVLYTILLFIFGIENPFAVAFICAFLNIVPYLGPLVAGILMVLFTASNYLGTDFSSIILPNTLYVLAGYVIIQLIDNIINQPLIFGQSVRSHPLEIFLVIIVSGLLFGIFGMIIAVPCYTAIKVIAKEAFSQFKIVQHLTKGL